MPLGYDHNEFRERLRFAIRKSAYDSDTAVSVASGRKPRTISNLFNQRDRAPSADLVSDLAVVLDVDPGWLMGFGNSGSLHDAETLETLKRANQQLQLAINDIESIRNKRVQPSIETVISWWLENNGRLENCAQILEFSDIYRIEEGQRTVPIKLGPQSLASQTLKSTDPKAMQDFINRMPDDQIMHISKLHYECLRDWEYQMRPQRIFAVVSEKLTLGMFYNRLIVPVKGVKGDRLIVNLAQLIEPPKKIF
ncbi:MAG: helix-turn-helix transcriptional regulator [Pseudomonadota bacterium]